MEHAPTRVVGGRPEPRALGTERGEVDIFISSSYHDCYAAAAEITRTFKSAFGVTPRRMHAAEEEILLGPGMGFLAERQDVGLRFLRETGLKTYSLVTLHMKSRSVDSLFEIHLMVEQIDGDLKNCGADPVRAAGAERRHRAIGLHDNGRGHHG